MCKSWHILTCVWFWGSFSQINTQSSVSTFIRWIHCLCPRTFLLSWQISTHPPWVWVCGRSYHRLEPRIHSTTSPSILSDGWISLSQYMEEAKYVVDFILKFLHMNSNFGVSIWFNEKKGCIYVDMKIWIHGWCHTLHRLMNGSALTFFKWTRNSASNPTSITPPPSKDAYCSPKQSWWAVWITRHIWVCKGFKCWSLRLELFLLCPKLNTCEMHFRPYDSLLNGAQCVRRGLNPAFAHQPFHANTVWQAWLERDKLCSH